MTAKQKQNIARFKRVVAEAKKLRKKNPGLTQPQAVKQAWAILYKSGKKVGATKIIEKGEKKNAKVTKVLQRIRTKKGAFKGIKRVAGSSHKDTKSHNVNIRVVSGVLSYKDEVKKYILKLNECTKEISRVEKDILDLKYFMKTEKGIQKKHSQRLLNNFKNYLSELKKHKTQLKKLI